MKTLKKKETILGTTKRIDISNATFKQQLGTTKNTS